MKLYLTSAFISLSFIIGLVCYLKGIFLTKYTVTKRSDSSNFFAPLQSIFIKQSTPLTKFLEKFNQAKKNQSLFHVNMTTFILIDALRPDFMIQVDNPTKNYHNILRSLQNLNKTQPQNTLLKIAYSDPPTITMQRIKGIATGSLPTFIQFGDNFAAKSMLEDNFFNQLSQQTDKKSYFVGDDTWVNLLPTVFTQAYPMDSFNIKDLDTVDSAVIKNVTKELKLNLQNCQNRCFSFILGHMLGVDHVGHSLDANHPEMKIKLHQINYFTQNLINIIKSSEKSKNHLLVIISDHGMTESGNHGGASEIQYEASMFAYTESGFAKNLKLSSSRDKSLPDKNYVLHIDIMVTLSNILQIPISFNNLGSIMPQFIPEFNENFIKQLEMLIGEKQSWDVLKYKILTLLYLNNYAQILQFYSQYKKVDTFQELDVDYLQRRKIVAGSLFQQLQQEKYIAFIEQIKQDMRDVLMKTRRKWATFDQLFLRVGTLLLVLSVILLLYRQLMNFSCKDEVIQSAIAPGVIALSYLYSLFSQSLIALADLIVPSFSIMYVLNLAFTMKYDQLIKQWKKIFGLLLILKMSRFFDPRVRMEEQSDIQQYLKILDPSQLFTYKIPSIIATLIILYKILRQIQQNSTKLSISIKVAQEALVLLGILAYNIQPTRIIPQLIYILTAVSILLGVLNYSLLKTSNPKFLILCLILDIWNIDLLLGGCISGIITSIIIVELYTFHNLLQHNSIYSTYYTFNSFLYGCFTYFVCLQGFFQLGHLTQFATLQIANSYIGFQQFNKVIHGTLLGVYTTGTLIIGLLTSFYLLLDDLNRKEQIVNHVKVIVSMAVLFVTITCIDTMWNREELHFSTDFAPRLIFEIGIGVVFLVGVGLLRGCLL